MRFTYLTLSVTQQIGMCIKLDINLAKFRRRQEIFLLSKQCVAKLPSLASCSFLRALKHIKSSVNLWQSIFQWRKQKEKSFEEILRLWGVNMKVITDLQAETLTGGSCL